MKYLILIGVVIAACLVTAKAARAEEVTVTEQPDRNMWVLSYTNLDTSGATTTFGETVGISWLIERLGNLPCIGGTKPAEDCADTITVTPPTGFIAVPDTVTINEGEQIDILIVPDLFG